LSRNYVKEYANYQGKSKQIERRSNRNKSRRGAVASGIISKKDSRDIHHKDGNPANKVTRNLTPVSKKLNRSRKI
jgi:hypothetical protein